jgi:hypothetical protein
MENLIEGGFDDLIGEITFFLSLDIIFRYEPAGYMLFSFQWNKIIQPGLPSFLPLLPPE